MVIQTNKKEFKGKILQEYLEWKYPTQEDKERVKEINIDIENQDIIELLEGGELDLRGFVNLKVLVVCRSNLTSVDFLNTLLNPEKLERLVIFNNNIQSTDIEFFSKFINLKELRIGTTRSGLFKGEYNEFYGSLKSWKNLVKLESIGI